MGYAEDYENYKTGDWLEIERELEKDYIPEDSEDEWNHMIYMGLYHKFFERSESILGRTPNLYDYHVLYNKILDKISEYILMDYLWLLMCGEELSVTYEDIIVAFEKEKQILTDIFEEYAKVEKKSVMAFDNKTKDLALTNLQKHLVGKELLYPDEKRVVKNLNALALEIVIFTKQPVTSQFLLENFFRRNGVRYSQDSCDNARDFA